MEWYYIRYTMFGGVWGTKVAPLEEQHPVSSVILDLLGNFNTLIGCSDVACKKKRSIAIGYLISLLTSYNTHECYSVWYSSML